MNRRNLLKTLALGAVGASAGSLSAQDTSPRRGQLRSLRMGVAQLHTPDNDPEVWAQKALERGFTAVNAPKVNLDDKDRIQAFIESVKKRNMIFAEVGRWVNLLDADSKKREENLKTVTEGLALAEELGAKCCVDIAGSFNKEK